MVIKYFKEICCDECKKTERMKTDVDKKKINWIQVINSIRLEYKGTPVEIKHGDFCSVECLFRAMEKQVDKVE